MDFMSLLKIARPIPEHLIPKSVLILTHLAAIENKGFQDNGLNCERAQTMTYMKSYRNLGFGAHKKLTNEQRGL